MKKYFNLSVILLVLFTVCLLPCLINDPESVPRLKVSFSETENTIRFPAGTLTKNCDYNITYYSTQDVSINIDGKKYLLETAIKENMVTIEEIIAQAQIDSKDSNICREKCVSNFGCTIFIYQYNDYDIVYRNDLFECSNGQQYLLKDFAIAPYDHGRKITLGYSVTKNGEIFDLFFEDWGLAFSVSQAETTCMSIYCEQEQGQQVDQLVIDSYWIKKMGDNSTNSDMQSPLVRIDEINIQKNGSFTFLIEWADYYGTLTRGSYILMLEVSEKYDHTQVHQFQKNYTDTQYYAIQFEIP